MLDVGRPRPAPELPDVGFLRVIDEHEDTTRYFFGEGFPAASLPGLPGEHRGPHREYVLERVPQVKLHCVGFAPSQSFARGGLAEAWSGGTFTFSEAELEDFPFGWDELAPKWMAARFRFCPRRT